MEDYERDSLVFNKYYGSEDKDKDISTSALDVPVHTEDDEPETMETQFNHLANTWKAETGMLSRLDQKYMHPAYQQIIGMGKAAIPFILRDLRATRGHWFWALRAIARENPVPQESAGDIDKVIEAWLEWGRKRGYDI